MKYRELTCRAFSIVLVVALVFSLVVPLAYAVEDDDESETTPTEETTGGTTPSEDAGPQVKEDEWNKVEELPSGYTRVTSIDQACENILSVLTTQTIDANNAFSSKTSVSAVVQAYASALAYADWFTINSISKADSDTLVALIPAASESTDKYKTALDNLALLKGEMSGSAFNGEKTLLGDHANEATGEQDCSGALDVSLPDAEDIVDPTGELSGEVGYQQAFQAIIENYIDNNVKGILSKYFEDQNTTLEAGFPETWWKPAAENNTFGTEMATVLQTVKAQLVPYINVYNNMMDAWGAAHSQVMPASSVVKRQAEETTYTAWLFVRSGADMSEVASGITRACACYYKQATSPGVTGDHQKDNSYDIDGIDQGILPALSNGKLYAGEVHFSDGADPNLTDLGYWVLGAGIVYDPFVSYAGNDVYLSVLEHFMRDTSRKDDLFRVLQTAINTKKPLYVTDGSKNKWSSDGSFENIPVASYRTAYLRDVIDPAKSTVYIFCVAKGEMVPSQVDSSTFAYLQQGAGTSSSSSSASIDSAIDQTANNSTGTIEGVGENNASAASGTYATPGTQELVASGKEMSKPVLVSAGMTGWFENGFDTLISKIGALTSLVVRNAAQDCKNNTHIQESSREMLFLNGLGDIVLYDGTVVLPAIANPVLYDYSEGAVDVGGANMSISGALEEMETTTDEGTQNTGYYPYTATFQNHYPLTRINTNNVVEITNDSDVNKFMLTTQKQRYEISQVYSAGKNVKPNLADSTTSTTVWLANNSFNIGEDEVAINLMKFHKQPQGFWRGIGGVFLQDQLGSRFIQTYEGGHNGDGLPYFPFSGVDAQNIAMYMGVAGPLVTSAVRYVSSRDDANELSPSGTFRVDSYVEDFIGQGLLGTQYSETLIKNNQLSYEELVNDQYNRLTVLFKDIVAGVLDSVGHIDGVLSLKDGYNNSFFNLIMTFLQKFYLLIAIALLIVVAVRFMKGQYNMLYVVMICVLVFSAFEVYAVWMPTAVPAAYNMMVNDIVEETVWNTVAVSAEKYEDTYKNANRRDARSGEERAYTATVTLYKMTYAEMENVAERAGVDYENIRAGDIVWLDRRGGIFIQGDQIKMSVDSLLSNNSMRGLYKSQWEEVALGAEDVDVIDVGEINKNPYIIKLTSPYVSLESYYTPFCQIERSLLQNLNNFGNIFQVERRVYSYGQDLYKDAFLFNAFIKSGIVMAPGDDEILKENIRKDQVYGDTLVTEDDIIGLCHQYFGSTELLQADWLRLRNVFEVPSSGVPEAVKNSLWGQMLQRKGYYTDSWQMTREGAEKLSQLITYINEQTRMFVINNMEQLAFMSDENAIKVVALYATTCFTHEVSEFGYWLYPNYINSSDIELVDVLYGAMTSLRDRNAALDGDIVNTVVLNLGFVGAILILFITLVAVVFVFVMTYLVPILYAMFGLIMVYKLMNAEQNIGLVKGYLKVTGVTVILYAVFSFGLRLVKFGGYNWYGYLACLLLIALCLYFLFYVVLSVVTNPMELGNETLMRNMFGALDRLTGNRLGRLTGNNVHIHSRNSMLPGMPFHRQFMRGASVDDRYSGFYPRRGQRGYGSYGYGGFGRWDDFESSYGGRRAGMLDRMMNGIGGRRNNFNSRTYTGYRTTPSDRPVSGARQTRGRLFGGRERSSSSTGGPTHRVQSSDVD